MGERIKRNYILAITEKCFVAFSDKWDFRIEGSFAILYPKDPESSIWFVLNKMQLSALLLMNGERQLGRIKVIMEYLLDNLTKDEIKKIIEYLFICSSNANNPFKLIETDDKPIETKKYDLKSFINKINDYNAKECKKINKQRLNKPLELLLMPSYNCFTDCIYCYAERKYIKKEDHMNIERWEEILDEAHDLEIKLAIFSGGDPFQYPHILRLLKKLADKGFIFVIPTKSHLNKETTQKLSSYGLQNIWFQISIDALSTENQKKLVNIKNYTNIAFDSIKNLVDENINVRVNIVLTPINYKEITDLIKKLDEASVKKISVAAYGFTLYRLKENLFLSKEQMDWVNKEVNKIKQGLKNAEVKCNLDSRDFSNSTVEEKMPLWDSRAACSGGRSAMAITPTGEVTLCEQMPLKKEYIVGDLKKQSIMDVWNSKELIEFIHPTKEKFKNTVCYECNEYDKCHKIKGCCFRDTLFTYDTIYMPPPNCPYAPPGKRLQ